MSGALLLLWVLLAFAAGALAEPKSDDPLERLAARAAPGVVALTLLSLAGGVVHGATFYWNPPRLVTTFAWLRGLGPYFDAGQGPVNDLIYPPLSVLAYLPAALAPTPFAALLVSQVLAVAGFLGPAALALLWRAERPRAAVLGLCTFTMVVLASYALRGSLFFHLVDPLALGFGMLACAGVAHALRGETARWLAVSAVAAVLATWSKQTLVLLVPWLLVAVGLGLGRAPLARFSAWLAGAGALVSGALLALFPPGPLFFNIWVLPAAHPRRPDAFPLMYAVNLVRDAREWALVVPVLLVALWAVAPRAEQGGRARARGLLSEHPWLVYVGAALALLPTSYLGFMKWGGRLNSMSLHTCFLALAACASFVSLAPRERPLRALSLDGLARWGLVAVGAGVALAGAHDGPHGAPLVGLVVVWGAVLYVAAARGEALASAWRTAAVTATLVWPVWLGLEGAAFTLKLLALEPSARAGPVLGAWTFAQQHRDQAYFPYDPLATLYTDGRLYHFDYGLFDRRLAGFETPPETFAAHLPARLRYVVYPRWVSADDSPRESLRYLPEFSALVHLRGFEPWDVYMRPEDAAAEAGRVHEERGR